MAHSSRQLKVSCCRLYSTQICIFLCIVPRTMWYILSTWWRIPPVFLPVCSLSTQQGAPVFPHGPCPSCSPLQCEQYFVNLIVWLFCLQHRSIYRVSQKMHFQNQDCFQCCSRPSNTPGLEMSCFLNWGESTTGSSLGSESAFLLGHPVHLVTRTIWYSPHIGQLKAESLLTQWSGW